MSLLGCTPTAPPTPSPSPPAPTAIPTPPETEIQREERLAYEAAEKVVVIESAEMDLLLQRGGASRATPNLRSVAGGPFLEEEVGILRATKSAGERTTGAVKIMTFQRAGYSPKELLLVSCSDGRSVKTFSKAGALIQKGVLARADLTLRWEEKRWKIWNATVEKVTTCD